MSGVTKRQETVALEKALMVLGKRIRMQHLYRGLLQLAYTGFAGLFVFFLVDWLTKMPFAIRILILLGGVGYGAFWFIRGPLARSRKPFSPEEIGLLVERQFPELHSRMISTLQLQAKGDLSHQVSENLVEGMLDQTFDQLPNIKMDALVDTGWVKRGSKYLAVAMALILASAVFGSGYFSSFIKRLVLPSVEYPTNTLIRKVDTPALIPMDSPFEMEVLAGGTIPTQGSVTIKTSDGFETEVDLFPVKGKKGTFVAEIPGLLREARYVVSLGDAKYGPKTIVPMPRPNIESMVTVVTAPEYTGQEPSTLLTGNAKAIIGSEFALTIRTTQDLKELKLVSEKHQALMPEMTKQADGSWVGKMSPTNSLAYTITMVSASGLGSDKLPRYRLSIVPDRAPKIRVQKPGITSDAAPVSKLPLAFTVRDDYGLESVKIYYATASGGSDSGGGAEADEGALLGIVYESFPVDGKVVDFAGFWDNTKIKPTPGQTVKFWIEATDKKASGPQVTVSQQYSITILSKAEYNDLLIQRLAEVVEPVERSILDTRSTIRELGKIGGKNSGAKGSGVQDASATDEAGE